MIKCQVRKVHYWPSFPGQPRFSGMEQITPDFLLEAAKQQSRYIRTNRHRPPLPRGDQRECIMIQSTMPFALPKTQSESPSPRTVNQQLLGSSRWPSCFLSVFLPLACRPFQCALEQFSRMRIFMGAKRGTFSYYWLGREGYIKFTPIRSKALFTVLANKVQVVSGPTPSGTAVTVCATPLTDLRSTSPTTRPSSGQ